MSDQRRNPRFKRKKSKVTKMQIEQRHVDNSEMLVKVIPDDVKCAMAASLMQFSQMDMSATHFVWDVLKLSADDGKLIDPHIDTLNKMELAKKLSKRYSIPIHEEESEEVRAWTLVRQMTEARNKIAHGVWYMIEDVPTVFSYRIPIEPGMINSETFTIERLNNITATCAAIGLLFETMCATARALHEEHPQPQS